MNQELIRIRELESAVEANRTLLALASEKSRLLQQQLICIGQELGGEQFDALLKDHLSDETPADKLAAEIVSIVKARLGGIGTEPDAKQVESLNREIESYRSQLDKQTKRAAIAEAQAEDYRNQAASFEKSLNEAREKIKEQEAELLAFRNPVNTIDHTKWLSEWKKSRQFDRDWSVLELVGRTGLARVKQIEDALVAQGVQASETTLRAVTDCSTSEAGLLKRDPGFSLRGRRTDVIRLTDKGRWLYTHLTGKNPLPCELEGLIKAYQTDLQGNLVLGVADHFTRLGFNVTLTPEKIKIEENRYFWPDLIARKDGETCYIEVETGEKEDRSSAIRKWENALVVGGGRIYLVARKTGSMNSTQSQILKWVTENGKKCRLYATSLEILRSIKPGESPWARIREL